RVWDRVPLRPETLTTCFVRPLRLPTPLLLPHVRRGRAYGFPTAGVGPFARSCWPCVAPFPVGDPRRVTVFLTVTLLFLVLLVCLPRCTSGTATPCPTDPWLAPSSAARTLWFPTRRWSCSNCACWMTGGGTSGA